MKKSLLIATLITLNGSAMAMVDWTPYLKGMQNFGGDGCDIRGHSDIPEWNADVFLGQKNGKYLKSNMPKALQNSVSKYTAKRSPYQDPYADTTFYDVDIQLKNAVAFNKPITRITSKWGNTYKFTVHFSDGNFAGIKPQFYMTVNDTKYPVGSNKYWAYDAGDSYGSYYSISQAQYNKLKNGEDVAVIAIHDNGWHTNDFGEYSLNFNSKNKTISCHFRFFE